MYSLNRKTFPIFALFLAIGTARASQTPEIKPIGSDLTVFSRIIAGSKDDRSCVFMHGVVDPIQGPAIRAEKCEKLVLHQACSEQDGVKTNAVNCTNLGKQLFGSYIPIAKIQSQRNSEATSAIWRGGVIGAAPFAVDALLTTEAVPGFEVMIDSKPVWVEARAAVTASDAMKILFAEFPDAYGKITLFLFGTAAYPSMDIPFGARLFLFSTGSYLLGSTAAVLYGFEKGVEAINPYPSLQRARILGGIKDGVTSGEAVYLNQLPPYWQGLGISHLSTDEYAKQLDASLREIQ